MAAVRDAALGNKMPGQADRTTRLRPDRKIERRVTEGIVTEEPATWEPEGDSPADET